MFTDGGAGPGDPWAGGGPPGPLQPSSGASYSGGYSGPPQNSQAPYSSNNIHLPHDSIVSTLFSQQLLVKVRMRRAGHGWGVSSKPCLSVVGWTVDEW